MKGTKKPRTFVFMYVCGVCVSVSVSFIMYLSMVIGSVWHSWQVCFLLLHSGPVGSAARSQRCCC